MLALDITMSVWVVDPWIETYVVGELFPAGVALGLALPARCADKFGVAEVDVRCAGGEFEAAEGAIST